METLESIWRRIHTAEQLHGLVRTMKALAAVNIRQFERAVAALHEYQATVELALQATLRRTEDGGPFARQSEPRRLGAVVCGSDQGMCGPLNDRMVRFAESQFAQLGFARDARSVIAVGQRVASRIADAGEEVDSVLSMSGTVGGLASLAETLLMKIDQWREQEAIERVVVFYCEHLSRAAYEPRRIDLLPIDRVWLETQATKPWPTQMIPHIVGSSADLFSELIRQTMFVSLYRACAESQASENASRLLTMRGAEQSIGEHLDELTRAYHQQRQMAITEELLDIASGFESLEG